VGALVLVLDREGRIIRFKPACEQKPVAILSRSFRQKIWILHVPEEVTVSVDFVNYAPTSCPATMKLPGKADACARLIAW